MQAIPAAHLPDFQNVQMVISRGALGGWVEQASPACGAASVAGAWNAIKPEGEQASILSTKLSHLESKRKVFLSSGMIAGGCVPQSRPMKLRGIYRNLPWTC